ncbi:IclR family transcriptional regulator [Alkalilimnicola ehrlichii]|uniref:IclR family transcriptional regulator n=1 Tax=Alkalilimnicola ehrlichii TaxID=351052 RepID=A0A3E0WQX0_9GAMM|nr:IclR family transcriptional regulator [Alkalilimnicola ehrlichii]RFA27274.1 IclR family transcriptional regulator [Alkalilimnicola ehrlichii]RFA34386.1 IclR family transcriptional regulator [Alkalilimnicola ehrlichii]
MSATPKLPGGSDQGRDFSKDRNFVTALARGLELLRAFGPGDEYLGNAELARRTGIPRPTVSRLTSTLTTLGYLKYSDRLEKYQLGAGVLALGFRYLASMGVRNLARPLMQELADATDCMVALGAEDRQEMTYLETCQGSGPLVLRLEVGARIPVATSAMGRAYLAGLKPDLRAPYLERLRAIYGVEWPRIEEELQQAFESYQQLGFCYSVGEWDREVSGVGVPLVLDGGAEVLAFNCGGSSLRLSEEVLKQNLGPRLVDLVERVSVQIGAQPGH